MVTQSNETSSVRTGIDGWSTFPARLIHQPDWPEAPDSLLWRSLIGRPPHGALVIIDEQVGERSGQLRSLPLLRALGVTRFTFPNGWRGLEPVPFEWVRIADDTDDAELGQHSPICQVVSQEIEDASQGDVAFRLLRAHQATCGSGLLIYVFDSPRFARARGAQVRPFADQHELPQPISYQHLFHRWRAQVGLETPAVTLNPVFDALHAFMANGRRARGLDDLLNLEFHRPDSPLWSFYQGLCLMANDGDDSDQVRSRLRAWIDADITRVTDRVLSTLQGRDYDPRKIEQLRAHRARMES